MLMNNLMKYRLVIKKLSLLLVFTVLNFSLLFAQVPARPQPPKLVNDLVGILTTVQVNQLESVLVGFADTTSNQIAVVIVPELYGMDKAELAYSIGETWQVGQKKFDNGVVILIKPKKDNEKGEVFIATGYGLEGVMTDAVCRRIIENNMIPYFIEDDYFGGIISALKVIFPLVSGEISSKEFMDSGDDGDIASFIFLGFILFIAILLAISGKNGPKNIGGKKNNRRVSAFDLFLLGSILNNSGSHSSGMGGGFSGGGFGGGGFGGFGGGSFGGGVAGGSW